MISVVRMYPALIRGRAQRKRVREKGRIEEKKSETSDNKSSEDFLDELLVSRPPPYNVSPPPGGNPQPVDPGASAPVVQSPSEGGSPSFVSASSVIAPHPAVVVTSPGTCTVTTVASISSTQECP